MESEDRGPAEVMMAGRALNWKEAGVFAKLRGIQHVRIAVNEVEKESGFRHAGPHGPC